MEQKNIKRKLNPIALLLIIFVFLIGLSSILSIAGIDTQKTVINGTSLETTILVVKNPLTYLSIKDFFTNFYSNTSFLRPLIIIVLALSSIGILNKSGFLDNFSLFFKNRKPYFLITFTVLLSLIFSFLGIYAYVFLLPIMMLIYQKSKGEPILGLVLTFLTLTLGSITLGFLTHDVHVLGNITQLSATIEIDKSYQYKNLSTILISLTSLIVLLFVIIMSGNKFKDKVLIKEEVGEIKSSKEGMFFSCLVMFSLIITLIYFILPLKLPLSGILLDEKGIYIERTLSQNSLFFSSFGLFFSIIIAITGMVYGFVSKTFNGINDVVLSSYSLIKKISMLLVLFIMFSQINYLVDYTNLGEWTISLFTNFMSGLQFSGLPLIILFFLIVVLSSLLVPSLLLKWNLFAPTIVPLFMRSNITPEFTQFIFFVADAIGKVLSPLFIYGMLFITLVNNHKEIGFYGMLKKMLPLILIIVGIWVLIISAWYIIGIPLGIGSYTTF